jgi:hypothetical protein
MRGVNQAGTVSLHVLLPIIILWLMPALCSYDSPQQLHDKLLKAMFDSYVRASARAPAQLIVALCSSRCQRLIIYSCLPDADF